MVQLEEQKEVERPSNSIGENHTFAQLSFRSRGQKARAALLLHLQRRDKRLLRDLHPPELAHLLLAFLLLLQQLPFARRVAAVAFGVTSFLNALTVSRAMILPPIAAWIGTWNICGGISSLSFSTILPPAPLGSLRCTSIDSASTGSR